MSVSLTPAAVERVRSFLAKRGHGVGLRLGVKKTGCSGFAYVVNYAEGLVERPYRPGVLFEGLATEAEAAKAALGSQTASAAPMRRSRARPIRLISAM